MLSHNQGKITIDEIGKHLYELDYKTSNVPGYVKYVKDELCKENCRSVEVGWFCKDDITDHTGIVLLINGRKKSAVDYVNKEDQLAQRSKPSIAKGKVTIGNYNESGSF